jgi:ligand-binding sensor domain-containing protein/signal transduction histidine kinase
MMARRGFSIISLIFLTGFLLASQRIVLADSNRYYFDTWTSGDGLPQNSVYSVLQTADGYLWLTTLDGLARYDGARFKVFNKVNSKGIKSNRFTKLFEDRDKNLWICTEDGGLIRYRDGSFTTYTTDDGLPGNGIADIHQNDSGELFVRTSRGLAQWQDGRFTLVSTDSNHFDSMPGYEGRLSAGWHKLGTTFRRVEGLAGTEYALPELSKSDPARLRFYEDRQGRLWVSAYQHGLFMLKDGTITRYTTKDGLPPFESLAFCEDREGALWLGTSGGGLVRLQDSRFTTFTTEEGLPSNQIMTICQDREGTLWVGTNNNGLVRITKKIVQAYLPTTGSGSQSSYPMIEDRAGTLWIGGDDLFRFKDGVFSHYPLIPINTEQKSRVHYRNIGGLYEDHDGRIWIGTPDKLISYKDGKLTDETAILGDTEKLRRINAIHRDRRGTLWLGTRNGLFEYKDGKTRHYKKEDGLPDAEITVLLEDRQGTIWIGTYGGLVRYQNSGFTAYTENDGLSSNQVRSLYEDSEGILWIGTYDGGLNRFKDGRLTRYTTDDGLFANGVFQILEDDAGNLWMSSNQGIYRVSLRQLNDFAAGKLGQITSISYGVEDGMLNSECNGGRQPAGLRARDGRLWFPTVAGVVVVDPKGVSFNPLPPPVLIESVLHNRKEAAFKDTVEIPAGQQTLEIQYTGLSLIKPKALRFRYKIEGLDADWTEAGNRRTAFYSHLPAGEYSFRVVAANADGVWNEEGAAIRLIVIPPFYQMWWFRGLVILSLLGIVALIYHLRIENLKRAQAAQEEFSRRLIEYQEGERKRIAGELHDSIGQSLAIIKNHALFGLSVSPDLEDAREQLDHISAHSAQAIDEVKDIAYNLRPYLLDRLGLTKAIASMLDKVAYSSDITFASDLAPIDDLFSKESEIHLYRIVQESISNIVKHAAATEVDISIKQEAGMLTISIRDDGKGFRVEPAEGHRSGFGLIGIAERARMLGAKLAIQSAPGKGTLITIVIPVRKI